MDELDRLLTAACKCPNDENVRSALADYLERADRRDLARAVHSHDIGPDLLEAATVLAKRAALPLSIEILWAAHVLFPRLAARHELVRPTPTGDEPAEAEETETPRPQHRWRPLYRIHDAVHWIREAPSFPDIVIPERWGLK